MPSSSRRQGDDGDAGERVVRVRRPRFLPQDYLLWRRRVDPRVDGVAIPGRDREGVGRHLVRGARRIAARPCAVASRPWRR